MRFSLMSILLYRSNNVVYYRIRNKTNCLEPVKVRIYRDHPDLEKLELEVWEHDYYNYKFSKMRKSVKCKTYSEI